MSALSETDWGSLPTLISATLRFRSLPTSTTVTVSLSGLQTHRKRSALLSTMGLELIGDGDSAWTCENSSSGSETTETLATTIRMTASRRFRRKWVRGGV